jgi:hypothetical protein
MDRRLRASPSVVAAGVVAVIVGVLGALSLLSSVLVFSRMPLARPIPPELRPILYGLLLFLLCCALLVIVVGIEVIRLRRWARIAILLIAGCMLFFGVIGAAVILLSLLIAPVDPALSNPLPAFLLASIYGGPIAIATWWLVLFTRAAVVEQFDRAAPPVATDPGPSFLNNPQCPLAVRIVAWYLASFVLFLPFLPFLPFHIPAYFLGHLYRGPAASLILIFDFVLLAAAGIGLLLVKRWGYALTLATQIFFCVNGLYSAFSSSFESMVRSVMSEMNLPQLPSLTPAVFRHFRYFNLLGLIIPLAIIVTLLFCKRAFFAAANGTIRGNSYLQSTGKGS